MIGCPLGVGRSFVLPTYLKHLHDLDYPKKKIHIAFLFNYPKSDGQIAVPHTTINQQSNNTGEIERIREILQAFKRKTQKEYRHVSIHEYTGNYEDRTIQGRRALGRWMEYFAEIRNHWIDMRCEKDEYVFSVDSDILVPQDSLKRLLKHDKDIVSLLLANGPVQDPYISPNRLDNALLPYTTVHGGIYPSFIDRCNTTGRMAFNVMMRYSTITHDNVRNEYDRINYRHIDPAELHCREVMNYKPDIYFDNLKTNHTLGPWTLPTRYGELPEVDMTGAAYLIKRDVLDRGVRYGFHHQGEDCFFSCMAQKNGFKLYCDYTVRANHIMNEQVYHDYLATQQLRVIGMPQPRGVKPVNPVSNVDVELVKVNSY